MKYIVSVSGGLGSFEALRRTIEKHGKENVRAVFADVRGDGNGHFWSTAPFVDGLLHERYGGEARDLYRFLWETSYHFGIPIERLEDGRTIYRVMAENRAFRLWAGSGFVHFCSDALKKRVIQKWIQANFQPGEYTIVLGMGWDEQHRIVNATAFWRKALGWDVSVTSPLTESPLVDNCDIERELYRAGIEVPGAYYDGFEHNNCNKGCISAGLTHFANLYLKHPEIYLYWAYIEYCLQRYWGKDKAVTILKSQRDGITAPLSLYDFIERIKVDDYPKMDWGACGCFSGLPQQLELFPLKELTAEAAS